VEAWVLDAALLAKWVAKGLGSIFLAMMFYRAAKRFEARTITSPEGAPSTP
jgi:hypothetical protein